MGYDPITGEAIVGPVSHGKTVSLSVSPRDSHTVAVTGWPSIKSNSEGEESVWITQDAGKSWIDVTGNLVAATSTIGKARPSGLLLIDFPELNSSALLVGTVSGVYLTWTDSLTRGLWSRLGSCAELPLVMVPALSYEHYSDTLVAGTMGRGVFTLHSAKKALLRARMQQESGNCDVKSPPWQPSSSAQYFPGQDA
jgi:hypothetical protein